MWKLLGERTQPPVPGAPLNANGGKTQKKTDGNWIGLWIASSAFFIVLSFCTVVLSMDSLKHFATTLLICSVAAMLGWGLGTVISPYSDETEAFSQLWTAISGLLSGIILAKAYDFASGLWNDRDHITSLNRYRIGLAVAWFILFIYHTFLSRHYSARIEGRTPVSINSAILDEIRKWRENPPQSTQSSQTAREAPESELGATNTEAARKPDVSGAEGSAFRGLVDNGQGGREAVIEKK